jgi:hypothetical protein
MKYMLLMQFSVAGADFPQIDSWSPDEIKAHLAFMDEVHRQLTESGELADARGLAMPDQARIVRASADGEPVVTEGPFPETKEFLAGYWIVDCENADRAVRIAAHVSTAPGPGGAPLNMPIEVRQVMDGPPEEI